MHGAVDQYEYELVEQLLWWIAAVQSGSINVCVGVCARVHVVQVCALCLHQAASLTVWAWSVGIYIYTNLQVANGIPIESWYDDPDDEELKLMLPFLEDLAARVRGHTRGYTQLCTAACVAHIHRPTMASCCDGHILPDTAAHKATHVQLLPALGSIRQQQRFFSTHMHVCVVRFSIFSCGCIWLMFLLGAAPGHVVLTVRVWCMVCGLLPRVVVVFPPCCLERG